MFKTDFVYINSLADSGFIFLFGQKEHKESLKKNILVIAFSLLIMAVNAKAADNGNILEPFNIKYDYSLFEDRGITDCKGTLTLSLHIPDGVSHIIFRKTSPHYTPVVQDYIFFSSATEIHFPPDETIINVSSENIRSGTYFKIDFTNDDGEHFSSSIYNINSFISQSDLDIISYTSGIQDVENHGENMTYDPRTKTLMVDGDAYCEIMDLSGRYLFKGHVLDSISLADSYTHMIIVRYTIDDRTLVKKIKL